MDAKACVVSRWCGMLAGPMGIKWAGTKYFVNT